MVGLGTRFCDQWAVEAEDHVCVVQVVEAAEVVRCADQGWEVEVDGSVEEKVSGVVVPESLEVLDVDKQVAWIHFVDRQDMAVAFVACVGPVAGS